ncbi:peptide-methionine (S)-S-oxide reductase [Flavobacterium sp. RHBU_24]|uniref:peptide-methionine (S)-S-oxide reductase n=1 Tax=Flavobacterium sp. RHBU_24 TaxID=3391185 RepID=UPI0039846518
MIKKAGFGGGCHWCTEAVFLSLKGVVKVEQGWISSVGESADFSEGVLVEFNTEVISFEVLIAIHLHTHSSTALHSMRGKYRSAIYTFNEDDAAEAKAAITALQAEFDRTIITQVLPFADFKLNKEEQLNYYFTDPNRPFCENYINPKLQLLRDKFSNSISDF